MWNQQSFCVCTIRGRFEFGFLPWNSFSAVWLCGEGFLRPSSERWRRSNNDMEWSDFNKWRSSAAFVNSRLFHDYPEIKLKDHCGNKSKLDSWEGSNWCNWIKTDTKGQWVMNKRRFQWCRSAKTKFLRLFRNADAGAWRACAFKLTSGQRLNFGTISTFEVLLFQKREETLNPDTLQMVSAASLWNFIHKLN